MRLSSFSGRVHATVVLMTVVFMTLMQQLVISSQRSRDAIPRRST
jgi:hypothetical protein